MTIVNALPILGWMTDIELQWLANVAAECQIVIEFGCYHGRSTRVLADNCKGVVYAVDPWNGTYHNNDGSINISINTDCFEKFKENLEDSIRTNKTIPVRCHSYEFYEPIQADFIFIDGDHRYESVKIDIEVAKRLARLGTVIAGHDYTHDDWPGVKKAVDEIYSNVNQIGSIWWVINE